MFAGVVQVGALRGQRGAKNGARWKTTIRKSTCRADTAVLQLVTAVHVSHYPWGFGPPTAVLSTRTSYVLSTVRTYTRSRYV